MVKPILKIELPNGANAKDIEEISSQVDKLSVSTEYHIIVCVDQSEDFHLEIITASDIKLHQNGNGS